MWFQARGCIMTQNPCQSFFESPVPARQAVRLYKVVYAIYGFGDASSGGFGSTFLVYGNTEYTVGVWGREQDDKTSNWKEFANMVDGIKNLFQRKKVEASRNHYGH